MVGSPDPSRLSYARGTNSSHRWILLPLWGAASIGAIVGFGLAMSYVGSGFQRDFRNSYKLIAVIFLVVAMLCSALGIALDRKRWRVYVALVIAACFSFVVWQHPGGG